MNKIFVDTLIIGSGFSGRTIASCLDKEDILIIDRGEKKVFTNFIQRYERLKKSDKTYWQTAKNVYESELDFNKTYDLSGNLKSFSQFHFIGGGSSNRWDGNAVRIPKYIFNDEGTPYLEWPFTYEHITPYYIKAERLLNLCGDHHTLNPGSPPVKINSGDKVRSVFSKVGLDVYLRNQAKNPIYSTAKKNKCLGLGICEVCKLDAKARPENIFPEHNIKYETLAQSIYFVNNRATSVKCLNSLDQEITINFNRLVIAAHAIESARLIWNSRTNLPKSVNLKNIGHYFQDHAQANIIIETPFNLDHYWTPFKSSFEICELSRKIEGIDIRVSFSRGSSKLNQSEWSNWLINENSNGPTPFSELCQKSKNFLEISLTYEIPPDHTCYIDFSSETPKLNHDNYNKLQSLYDKIYYNFVKPSLESRGFKIVAFRPHYRHIIGQHHLVGTLNMSKNSESVVDKNLKLIGTDNVYIAGASAIPRLGAANPTLTAIALSFMLGESLFKN